MRLGKKNEMLLIEEANAPPPKPLSVASTTNVGNDVPGSANAKESADGGHEQEGGRDGRDVAPSRERREERAGDAQRRAAQPRDRGQRVVLVLREPPSDVLHPGRDHRPERPRREAAEQRRHGDPQVAGRDGASRLRPEDGILDVPSLEAGGRGRREGRGRAHAIAAGGGGDAASWGRCPCSMRCRVSGACWRTIRRTTTCIHSEADDREDEEEHPAGRPDAGPLEQVAEDDRADEAAEPADHADDPADDADVVREVVGDVAVDRRLPDPHRDADAGRTRS